MTKTYLLFLMSCRFLPSMSFMLVFQAAENQTETRLKASWTSMGSYILERLTVQIMLGAKEIQKKVNSFFSLEEFLFYSD